MSTFPAFSTDQKESDFWDSHDSTELMDSTEEVDIQFVDNRSAMKQISECVKKRETKKNGN